MDNNTKVIKIPKEGNTWFRVDTEYPEKTKKFEQTSLQLPGKTTLRRKIKLCIDILFDRTYKR